MLVGKHGAGKSSTVKSVLRFIMGTNRYIDASRISENSLGYLNIKTYNGKVLFIEQIDKKNINYLLELMSEHGVSTITTEEVVKKGGRKSFEGTRRYIPGQPVVITTSVAEGLDIEREQLYSRFLKVYVDHNKTEGRPCRPFSVFGVVTYEAEKRRP
jgi:hypothetical protein